MLIKRLIDWAFRIRCLPDMENGEYNGKLRPPTFYEAWHGISNT